MQQFTGSIGADGASLTIESVTGLVQEGVLAENGSEIIANTTLETDPICLVSWVYEEEAGRYDVVVDQYVYSSAMHIAGVANVPHAALLFGWGIFCRSPVGGPSVNAVPPLFKGKHWGDGASSPFEKNPTCLRIPAFSAAATGG